ncbi:hypothetical protein ACF0H5_024024 [Mactra antiquata]
MYVGSDDDFVNDDKASALLEELNTELKDTLFPLTTFIGIEACIGLIGNALVIIVFFFYYNHCNYRTFSICLSFIDLTCTFTTMAGEMVTQRFWYNYPVKEICKTKDFFNIFTVSAETFCLFVISFDRYRKICQPLKWQIGPKAAVASCFLVIFIASIVAAPIVEFWGVRTYLKTYKNTTILVTTCEKDERYEDTKYPFGYTAVVGGIIFNFLVAMFVLNVVVAKKLIYERRKGLLAKKTKPVSASRTNSIEIASATVSEVNFEITSDVDTNNQLSMNENILKSDDNMQCENKPGFTIGNIYDGNGITGNAPLSSVPTGNMSAINASTEKAPAAKVPIGNVSTGNARASNVPTGNVSTGNASERKTSVKSGKKLTQSEVNAQRIRRKALIMFILTSTFICTTIMYFTMVSILGSAGNIVNGLTGEGKMVFFFFLRFYFIQHIINPFLYVCLDQQIKQGIVKLFRTLFCCKKP